MSGLSLLLVVWLAGFMPQTPPPAQAEAPVIFIDDVQLRGNRHPNAQILFYMQTRPGAPYNPATLARDIQTLNRELPIFEDIRVLEMDSDRGGKIVIFEFTEKKLVRRIAFEGLKSVTESDVRDAWRERNVGLTPDARYDASQVRQAEGIIRAILAEKGRQQSVINVVLEDIPPNSLAVTFNIEEGPKVKIEEIRITGNQVFTEAEIKAAMELVKESGPITVFTGSDTYHDLKLQDDITRINILYGEHGYMRVNVLDPIIETRPTTIHRTLPFVLPTFPWGIPIPFWTKTVDRMYITIPIEENDQYRVGEVTVTGTENANPDFIKQQLGLNPGDVFNRTRVNDAFEELKRIYGMQGYINFVPQPFLDFDEERKLVNLTINIDEDLMYVVRRINFVGNTVTRDKVIRRELLVNEGQTFDSFAWDLSLLRLNQLGYFEEVREQDADIRILPPEPGADYGEVDLTLRVQERGRNSIGFNAGVSGVGGSLFGFNYETNNFLGFGETLAFQFEGGTRQRNVMFSFTEPYLFDRPISMGFSVFSSNTKYDQAREQFGLAPEEIPEGTILDNRLNYERKRSGFSVYTSYPLRLFQRLGITYQYDNTQTNAVNPATRDYFQAVTIQSRGDFLGEDFSQFRSRRLVPVYTYSTVDSAMTPTRGQALTASFELVGGFLGGNTNYYRPSIEYRFFRPSTSRRNVIAFRFMTSYVQGFSGVNVPFYERAYMGGDYDLRGFDFRSISPVSFMTNMVDVTDPRTGQVQRRPFDNIVYVGGDTQAVANLEYRIPLVGPITLAPFLDIGNTWVAKKDQLTREFLDEEGNWVVEGPKFLQGTNSGLRASTGVELQVIMPVLNAPFRLIYAHNLLRLDRLYFGPTTGLPIMISDPKRDFKFTVGRTF